MAETKTEAKKTGAALPEPAAVLAATGEGKPTAKAASGESGPPMFMRALIGFTGLSLLVGFFLPWIRIPERPGEDGTEAIAAHMASGLDLLRESSIGGVPPAALLAVPILGVLVSVAAFMGFRWAGHTAIAIASALLLLGLWVVLRLFVEHTDLGLWITVGGTFITLLLGVIALMLGRARAQKAPAKEPAEPSAKP